MCRSRANSSLRQYGITRVPTSRVHRKFSSARLTATRDHYCARDGLVSWNTVRLYRFAGTDVEIISKLWNNFFCFLSFLCVLLELPTKFTTTKSIYLVSSNVRAFLKLLRGALSAIFQRHIFFPMYPS